MALYSERDKQVQKTFSTRIKKERFKAVFKHTTHWFLVKGAQKVKTNT